MPDLDCQWEVANECPGCGCRFHCSPGCEAEPRRFRSKFVWELQVERDRYKAALGRVLSIGQDPQLTDAKIAERVTLLAYEHLHMLGKPHA